MHWYTRTLCRIVVRGPFVAERVNVEKECASILINTTFKCSY